MHKRKLILNAVNIHQGGGKTLLLPILSNCQNHNFNTIAFLDSRIVIHDNPSDMLKIIYVKPTIISRLYAEFLIYRYSEIDDVSICMGNLPPLFRLKSKVVVFLQNRFLVDNFRLNEFSIKLIIKISLQRWWFFLKRKNADIFLIQTKSMRNLLRKVYPKANITLFPLINNSKEYLRSFQSSKEGDGFLYVASGEPHKNHKKLIEAWCLLANEGIYPILKLTLAQDLFADLLAWIEVKRNIFNFKVYNLGVVSESDLKLHYANSSALIYPSKLESFGLPLIEARQANLSILASELDYVRDLIDPEESFDPNSALSIARAVKRFLTINNEPSSLFDADDLMREIMKGLN